MTLTPSHHGLRQSFGHQRLTTRPTRISIRHVFISGIISLPRYQGRFLLTSHLIYVRRRRLRSRSLDQYRSSTFSLGVRVINRRVRFTTGFFRALFLRYVCATGRNLGLHHRGVRHGQLSRVVVHASRRHPRNVLVGVNNQGGGGQRL